MCVLCAAGPGTNDDLAHRIHVLQLLALVEHPDALPADAALRLGREIMMLTRPEPGVRRCDPVAPPGPDIEETR
jgi:hypothetical protein